MVNLLSVVWLVSSASTVFHKASGQDFELGVSGSFGVYTASTGASDS